MKRPAKKKHKNPLLPDDAQVDERKLVDAEESAEISLEDRARMYWMENRAFISGCVTVLLVVVAGYQGLRLFMNYHRSEVQEAYAVAAETGNLEAFAAEHPGDPLGGLAALRTADLAYGSGDFETALRHYRAAAGALGDTLLAGRARLGEAFSLVGGGDEEAGVDALEGIVADNALAEAVRAEAGYHLAIRAHARGEEQVFASMAEQVAGLAGGEAWSRRLEFYRGQAR
jgi:predicted negative regulator of RcsB-dependent stress response